MPRTFDRRQFALRLLSSAIVLTCVGMAAATWRGDGTSINSFLFLAMRLSHENAAMLERSAMGAVLLLAICGAIWPKWELLLPVSLYAFAETMAGWHQGGYHFSELSPVARAPVFVVPIALVLLARAKNPHGIPNSIAIWALRLAMAAVFIAHGWEAFQLHPRFIDLILSSGYNLLGLRINESSASTALRAIALVDWAVALALLIRPWRPVLAWMSFWAALAAASRLTAHGWGAYPDLLVRAAFILTPLAIWALTHSRTPPYAHSADSRIDRSAA